MESNGVKELCRIADALVEFATTAEVAHWLSHPAELGDPPGEIEVVDRRVLNWPSDDQPREFWLLKFRKKKIAWGWPQTMLISALSVR